MKVSKQFLRDFAYLANFYGWTPADIEDVKAQTRVSVELRDYWTRLAAAQRAGYRQTENNGHIRLHDWLSRRTPIAQPAAVGAAIDARIAGAREAQRGRV